MHAGGGRGGKSIIGWNALDQGEEDPDCVIWYCLPQNKGSLSVHIDPHKERRVNRVTCVDVQYQSRQFVHASVVKHIPLLALPLR